MAANFASPMAQWIMNGLFLALNGLLLYTLRKVDRKFDAMDVRIDAAEDLAQLARLDNKDALLEVAKLRTHMSENYSGKIETNKSLERVHDKIESLDKNIVVHINQLRSEIREDIRDALQKGGKRD